MQTEDEKEGGLVKNRRSSFWATIKAVLWSFLGIRKRAAYEQDAMELKPLHLIFAGLILAFLFVLSLVLIVHWVVGSS